jgi:hypothetical protein
MNEQELLRKLAAAAHREAVPVPDVRRSVAEELSARDEEAIGPFGWIAGLSSAAAIPLVVTAISLMDRITDPLLGILYPFKWAML